MKKEESIFPQVKPLVLGLLSGVLLSVGYRIPGAWPLLFIALLPLLFGIYASVSVLEVLFAGAIAGLFLMGTATFWLFNSLPLPLSYGIAAPWIGFIVVATSWLLEIIATGMMVGIWAVLVRFLKLNRFLDLGAAAVLWVFAEFARMLSYNLLTIAPKISNPPFFSPGFLGYPLMDSESFRQIAAFGGIYACSFFVVAVNLCFYFFLRYSKGRKGYVFSAILASILLLISILPIASFRENFAPKTTQTIRVAILSVHVPPSLDESQATTTIAEQELSFVKDASNKGADIILLPEDSHLFVPFTTYTVGEFLPPGSSSIVTDSGEIIASDGSRPERVYEDTIEGVTGIRDKLVLTPQGEYIPLLFSAPLNILGGRNELQKFDTSRGFTTGKGIGIPLTSNGAQASVLFCLEVMDPGLALSLKEHERLNLILVPASHLIFKPSKSLEQDTLRYARAQAVESELPLASSVLQGTAFVLDPYGRELESVGADGNSGSKIITLFLAAGNYKD